MHLGIRVDVRLDFFELLLPEDAQVLDAVSVATFNQLFEKLLVFL